MIFKGDNPTDYPHLEQFIDWLYEHVEELPSEAEALQRALLSGIRMDATQQAWAKARTSRKGAP